MNGSMLQTFVQLLNLASGLVFLYCLFSIPAQIIRRFRLKKQGKTVSPILLIARKLLKYWFLTALILIPFSLVISYMALSEGGLSGSDIFVALVTQVLFGNIGTALLFGYVFMKAKEGLNNSVAAVLVRPFADRCWKLGVWRPFSPRSRAFSPSCRPVLPAAGAPMPSTSCAPSTRWPAQTRSQVARCSSSNPGSALSHSQTGA